jgi:hypothetical protein
MLRERPRQQRGSLVIKHTADARVPAADRRAAVDAIKRRAAVDARMREIEREVRQLRRPT